VFNQIGFLFRVVNAFVVLLIGTGSGPSAPSISYDIIIAAGQSNMTGVDTTVYGPGDSALVGMYQLRLDSSITAADQPLDFRKKKPHTVSPAFYFARKINQQQGPGDKPLLIIPAAKGGSGFSNNFWNPGDTLYRDMVRRVKYVTSHYPGSKVKAVVWLQGEADNTTLDSAAYLYQERLNNMIYSARKDLNIQEVPWIAGHVWPKAGATSGILYNAIAGLASNNNHMAVISASGLNHIGDKLHFDVASSKLQGDRYYDSLAAAQNRPFVTLIKYNGQQQDGKLTDNSDNEFSALAHGIVTEPDSKFGLRMRFSSSYTSIIKQSFINTLDAGVIEMSFKTISYRRMTLFSNSDTVQSGRFLQLVMKQGKIGLVIRGIGLNDSFFTPSTFRDNNWHNLKLIKSRDSLNLVIDNVSIGLPTAMDSVFMDYGYTRGYNSATIGAMKTGGATRDFFLGSLAKIAIYKGSHVATDDINPFIVSNVANGSICEMSSAIYRLWYHTPAGLSPIVSWRLNNVPIVGETGDSLTIAQQSSYKVQGYITFSDSLGVTQFARASDTVFTSVIAAPSATVHYSNYTAPNRLCEGDSIVFLATTNSTPPGGLAYQWRRHGISIPGATGPAYTSKTADTISVRLTEGSTQCIKASSGVVVHKLPLAEIITPGQLNFCPGGSVTLNATEVVGATYRWVLNGTNKGISPSQIIHTAGSAAVNVTSNGCSKTSLPVVVSLLPNPDLTLSVVGSSAVCEPNTVTVKAVSNANYTYAWYQSTQAKIGATNSELQATSGGSYRAKISAYGCPPKMTNTVMVDIKPKPTPQISMMGFNATGCKLRASTIGAGVTYQWLENGIAIAGATGRDFVASVYGTYQVEVSKGGCTGVSSVGYPVTLPTSSLRLGIVSSFESGGISIFPNPSRGVYQIVGMEDGYDVEIRTVLGKVVKIRSATNIVDLSEFPDGVYAAFISDGHGTVLSVERLVKN
jgi:hypothetical protein